MRLSKPSPAMVVAIIALVFAMTGTSIAAKSAWIDGKRIKPGSITSAQIKNGAITGKKLAPYAIAPQGIALRAVKVPVPAKKSAHRLQTGLDTNKEMTTADAAALLLEPIVDPDVEALKKKVEQNGIDTSESKLAYSTLGGQVNQIKETGLGVQSNRVRISAGAVTSNAYAPMTGSVTGAADFKSIMTATPFVATTYRNATVQLVSPAPGAKLPTQITVVLIARNGETNKDVGTGCSFDPRVATYCVLPGALSVPALSFVGWQVLTLKPDVSGPDFGQFDSFDLSMAVTPTVQ